MTEQEKGVRVAEKVWAWLISQEQKVEPIPWARSPITLEFDSDIGYKRCLFDLRLIIESAAKELE